MPTGYRESLGCSAHLQAGPYWSGGNSRSQNAGDLGRIRQIVTQNDLERGRIEYKRELDNGRNGYH
jgi:hypothetical protein